MWRGAHSRSYRAGASLSFRYIWRQLEQRFHVFHVTSAHFGHQDFLLVCDGSSGSEPGRRSARIPAGQTLREADTPAAQGNCASRRRTGRVRILLSLESIRTRPQRAEDAWKVTGHAWAVGEWPQRSTRLRARPPRAVSLYFEDRSAPGWRIVSITSSRLTRCGPSPHSAIRAALMALPAGIAL